MNNDYEIIIVGSGPAGISTWLHLNKLSPDIASKTLILEKKKHPREKICGGALLNQIIRPILHNLDFKLKIPIIDINHVKVISGNREFDFEKDAFMSIVDRAEFDEALYKHAKNKGALINQEETYLNLKKEQKAVILDTTEKTYKTRYVVGADGALSKIRKHIPQKECIKFASTLNTFLPVDSSIDNEFKSHKMIMDFSCSKNGIHGYLWHFPFLKNKQPYMNHGICNSRLIQQSPSINFKKYFINHLHSRYKNDFDYELKSHPVTYFDKNAILSDRQILLVGDAAGIEPLIGGGIHLSLLYGHIAAKNLVDSFNTFDLKNYSSQIAHNYVGKYISNSISMAKQIYTGKADIIPTIEKIFTM